MTRSLAGQLARFLVVGAIGFIIDGGLLNLLVWQGINPYLARAISFPPAVTTTWYLNRIWAFAARAHGPRRQYLRYLAVQIVGACGNYLIYALILFVVPHTVDGVLAAFAVGSAGGLLINFVGARMFVFLSAVQPARAAD